jgi:hypothetical protein
LKKKRPAWAITAFVLALMATVIGLANAPPWTDCKSGSSINPKEYRVQAVQTVAQPWRGLHHVYGIFMIPEQYKFDHLYTAKLTIQGIPADFQAGSPEDEDTFGVRAEPGHYIKRVYLSTPTAKNT